MAKQLKASTGIQVNDRSAINLKMCVQTLLNMASKVYFESKKKSACRTEFHETLLHNGSFLSNPFH
jgi:hypothetical protein